MAQSVTPDSPEAYPAARQQEPEEFMQMILGFLALSYQELSDHMDGDVTVYIN